LALESLHLLLSFFESDTRPHAAKSGVAGVVPGRERRDIDLNRRPDLGVPKAKGFRWQE